MCTLEQGPWGGGRAPGAWSETTHPHPQSHGISREPKQPNNPEKQAEGWRTHAPQEASFKADYEATGIETVWPWRRDQTGTDEPGGPPGGRFRRAWATSWGSGAGDTGLRMQLDPASHQMQKLAQCRAKVVVRAGLQDSREGSAVGLGPATACWTWQQKHERRGKTHASGLTACRAFVLQRAPSTAQGPRRGGDPSRPHVCSGHAARITSSQNSTEKGTQFSDGQRT